MLLHKHKQKLKVMLAHYALSLALTCQSCADYFFPEFKVENSYLEDEKAIVIFSSEANPTSVKKNFLFAQDEKEIEGCFEFCGSKVKFTPKEPIEQNHCYKIVVYSGAQDINGNTLQKEYKKNFYTKNDLSAPTIKKIQAFSDKNNNTEKIEITFSKAINQESFAENFSLEPSEDFFCNWSMDGKSVNIIFAAPLIERKIYSIKIGTGLKDIYNNTMANDFYWFWTNNECAKNPDYKVYAFEFGQNDSKEIFDLYENADFSKQIEIIFDKNVLADTLQQGIQIEPQTSYSIEPIYEINNKVCQRAKIFFNEKPNWGSEKILTIKPDIKDLSGFSVQKKKITIRNNSSLARPPKLECVILTVDEENIFISEKDNLKTILFPIDKYPCGTYTSVPIYFVFSISEHSKCIDKLSAYDGIDVSSYYAGTINLNAVESISEDDFGNSAYIFTNPKAIEKINQIKESQCAISAIKFNAQFKNAELNESPSQGIIEFCVNKNICDDKKNYLEEETRLTCNKI